MTKAVADFIEALLVHYPVRHDTEEREDAWVKSMIAALRDFNGDLLQEVANDIIRTRKYRNFPLLSEILDKCDEVEARRQARKREAMMPQLRMPGASDDPWSTERCKFAHDMKRSDLGKRAAREGWIVAYWHFCRRNLRAPEGREIEQCKQDSAGIDELYSLAMRGEAGMCSKAIAKWAGDILEKRMRWSEEALGR
jgi:hypothetical protein